MSLKVVQPTISSKSNIFSPIKWWYKSMKNRRISFWIWLPKSWEMSNLIFEKKFQNWLRHINNSYLSVCLFSMLDIHLRKGRIFIVGTSKLDIMNGWTPRNSQWVFTTSRFFCCCCLHPTFLMCNDLWCGGDNFWPLSLSLVVSLFRRPAF